MSLNDQFILDSATFINSDEFAETVTYKSWAAGEYTEKTIGAVINRQDPTKLPETSANLTDLTVVELRNDATFGVASVTEKRDLISFSSTYGGTTKDYLVVLILSNDAGTWKLRVRG